MTTVPPAPVSTADGTAAAFSPSDWATFSAIGLMWGASFLFIAVGLESIEPGLITSLRVSLGAITLALLPGSQIRLQAEDRVRMVGAVDRVGWGPLHAVPARGVGWDA